ncbi:hypothetical protein Tco_0810301 [Tanacetum coccineum]
MTSKAQQIALDNALVAPENQRGIGKCNMRINPRIKPKEFYISSPLDALGLTTLSTFLITARSYHHLHASILGYRQQTQSIISIQDRQQKIPGQEFNEPPSEEETLSFIRELGHSREIKYITDVMLIYLHQPWRTFCASIINKCLSGKDLAYQIDNKDSKKQDKMFYPRFTKIIIHHFLTKDKSISMRNRMFMHTARYDSLLGSMRFVSRHEDTQVYVEPPKSKKPKRKSDSAILSEETPSKKKPTKARKDIPSTKKPATKPKPTKKKAPIKADRGKGLNVLSEVAISEVAQLKEVTKRSKKYFHISHTSGSGDGTDFQSGVPDEQQRKISSTDEGTGAKLEVPDVPKYDSESDKESWGDSGEEDDTKDDEGNDDGDDSDGNDDDDDNDSNDNDDDDDDNDGNDDDDSDHKRTESDRDENPNLNQFNEEHEEKKKRKVDAFTDKEMMSIMQRGEKEESNDGGGIYQHNVLQDQGLSRKKMLMDTNKSHETQKTEGPMQSSSVSSDFTEKLLNFENISLADNEISSLMDTMVRHEEPSGQTSTFFTVPITVIPTTIPPPPHFFNPFPQKTTPTPTPTTSEATTSFPALPDFSSIFKFNDRVTKLETNLHIMQNVEKKLKLKNGISDFATLVIEQNVTESLEAVVLAKSSSQLKSTYKAAASLSEYELMKVLLDKMEESKSHLRADVTPHQGENARRNEKGYHHNTMASIQRILNEKKISKA